jgi:hypothetical protein
MSEQESITYWSRDTEGQVDFTNRWWLLHSTGFTSNWDGEYVTYQYTPLPDAQRDFTDHPAGHPTRWTEQQKFNAPTQLALQEEE